ncbi:MAG TPA: histidine phosphatase family protein [Bacteroidales bacterium]|nr:histidine phosphatase family protein [Bacteroidales bacterium]HRZ78174.1 histidine phosphatase family protein [Bacteroidales bacterium]
MKTVYLVRHAKASWEHPELPDRQRPLLPKGEARTRAIGEYLRKKKVKPELIISSDAVRARETALILAAELSYPAGALLFDPRLYDDPGYSFFDVLSARNNALNSVMLVGHNPGMTQLMFRYAGNSIDHLPTSGVVAVRFHTQRWEELPLAKHTLDFLVYPRLIHKEH